MSIAICHEGQLAELYLPEYDGGRLLGAIYKGRVANVLPGMQAAFVDIGLEKNSFLYADDVYTPAPLYAGLNQISLPKSAPRDIGSLLKEGQEVLVQILKEPQGDKGARVTMQPALPSRYGVLLPVNTHVAVSRRIDEEDERERLREIVKLVAKGQGAIVRTAAKGIEAEEIIEDFRSLKRLWKRIQGIAAKRKAPALIYHEQDILKKVIRDTIAQDIERIVVESAQAADKVREAMLDVAPELLSKICLRTGADLFAAYGVDEQMEKALRRRLWLKSGGYIVFDQTEALTVVDVNTGKFVGVSDLEQTMLTTNLEAVTEIARQLKLRNTGGIIIIDFINMEEEKHRKTLMDALTEELKKDRTRVTPLGMTNLGLVELTRKKVGRELSYNLEEECRFCRGKGRVLRADIAARKVLSELEYEAANSCAATLQVKATGSVAAALLGPQGRNLSLLEQRLGKHICIVVDESRRLEESVVCSLSE
ncbi:MAG: Rne/Rng family ribonuclease [Firmicutes bacterium]|nr:Rne/Rng family ribonuclease [Bacillota bacterium]